MIINANYTNMSGHLVIKEFASSEAAMVYLNAPENEVTQTISVIQGTPRIETVKHGNTWIQKPLSSDLAKVIATFMIPKEKHQQNLNDIKYAPMSAKAKKLHTSAGIKIAELVQKRNLDKAKIYLEPIIEKFKSLGPVAANDPSEGLIKIQQMLFDLRDEILNIDKLDLDVTFAIRNGEISLIRWNSVSVTLNIFDFFKDIEKNKTYWVPENISKDIAKSVLKIKFVEAYKGACVAAHGREALIGSRWNDVEEYFRWLETCIISKHEKCGSQSLWILQLNSGSMYSSVKDVTIDGLMPLFMISVWWNFLENNTKDVTLYKTKYKSWLSSWNKIFTQPAHGNTVRINNWSFNNQERSLMHGVDNDYIECHNKATYTGCLCSGTGFQNSGTYDVYNYKETLQLQEERKKIILDVKAAKEKLLLVQKEIISTVKQAMIEKGLKPDIMIGPAGHARSKTTTNCSSQLFVSGSGYENYYVNNIMVQLYDCVLPWLKTHNKKTHAYFDILETPNRLIATMFHPGDILYTVREVEWSSSRHETVDVATLTGFIESCNIFINVFEMVKRILPTLTNIIKTHWIPPKYPIDILGALHAASFHGQMSNNLYRDPRDPPPSDILYGTYLTSDYNLRLKVIEAQQVRSKGPVFDHTYKYISKTDEHHNILIQALKDAECMDEDSAQEFKKQAFIQELVKKIAECEELIKSAVKEEDYLLAHKIKTERVLYQQHIKDMQGN